MRDAQAGQQPGGTRRGILELACLAVGVVLGLFAVTFLAPEHEENLEDLALGPETTSVYARVDGHPIHCRTLVDADDCLATWREQGRLPVVLWLGNSQLHGVNQMKQGDETAAAILYPRLRQRGLHLVTFSQPNANLQEQLALFAYLEARLPVKVLILPVVFDDLRETGVRGDLLSALEDPATRDVLGQDEAGRRLMARYGKQEDGDLAALADTVQERSEEALTSWFGEHSALWALRPKLRGQLFKRLYRLRNTVLGITPQSKRRVIPGRMALNLEALDEILAQAQGSGIRTSLYIVPLRDDVQVPYDLADYAAFKRRVEAIARKRGASFANLESLVPAELWGKKRSTSLDGELEIDFMHFQAGGHVLLARQVEALVENGSGS
jgi:hypothetical protein